MATEQLPLNDIAAGVDNLGEFENADRQPSAWGPEEQEATTRAMEASIDILAKDVPELASERDRVLSGSTELANTYEVGAEFFEDPARSMIFFSLGYSNARLPEAEAQSANRIAASDQREFIANATFLLTRKYAHAFPEERAMHEHQLHEGSSDVEAIMAHAIPKYEQPEVTRELKEIMRDEDILRPTKERLGLDPQTTDEDVRNVHVLSIGRNASVHFANDENGVSWKEASKWSEGLEERGREFAKEVPGGELASLAAGFAVEVNGEEQICVPQASAEVVLAAQKGVALSEFTISSGTRSRVISTLRHEFTHTKGSVNVGDAFGKSLEERRAEWFSGDHGEYFEVKRFFRHTQILFGKDIGEMFDENVAARSAGNEISIYQQLANAYGLDMVAEVAAAQPDAYVRFAKSQFTHDMLKSLGGYDAIIARQGSSSRIDKDDVLRRVTNGVNGLRAEYGSGGQDEGYEEYLGSYLAPVFTALGVRLQDIPYTPPEPKQN